MPGVAQVWLTANELHALVKVSTEKGTILSPRYRDAILPKLEEARMAVGCPVPFATKERRLEVEALAELDNPHDSRPPFVDLGEFRDDGTARPSWERWPNGAPT